MTDSLAFQPSVPAHLGLILDGNRRWAKQQGIAAFEGHRRGYENLKTIGDVALQKGVKYLTAFVFSTENWQRAVEEVKYLMDLFYWVATNEVDAIHDKNVRLRFVGSKTRLDSKLIDAIASAEAKTKNNTAGTLALCLNYGGQQEIADAAKQLIAAGTKAEAMTPELLGEHLYAPDLPPLDLIIRTSGEQRLSNFMLWRAAYSELVFSDKLWPEFTEADLDDALRQYAERQRRFGQ